MLAGPVWRIVLPVADGRRRAPVTTPSVSPADATAGCGISQHVPHVASEHRTLPQRLTTNVKWPASSAPGGWCRFRKHASL